MFEINEGGIGVANTGSGSSPCGINLLISNSCMILSGVGSSGGVVALLGFDAIFTTGDYRRVCKRVMGVGRQDEISPSRCSSNWFLLMGILLLEPRVSNFLCVWSKLYGLADTCMTPTQKLVLKLIRRGPSVVFMVLIFSDFFFLFFH